MGIKRGIIQSRGLGDIVIALPIAKHYHDQGDEIVWPICKEFHPSFVDTVPWVNWVPIETDATGAFFLETPLRVFKEMGVDVDEALYLYQYLNSRPDLTDPELFNILKFDQYKYWISGVPFMNKWKIKDCITRNAEREQALTDALNISGPFALTHLKGSSFEANIDVSWLDPAVRIINVDDHLTDCIFDWLGLIEKMTAFVGVDSVFANLIDSWGVEDADLYWIRRSNWDLTPVLGSQWTIVPTSLPILEPKRVDPREQVENMRKAREQAQLKSNMPFQSNSPFPTSFLNAVKPSNPNPPGLEVGGAVNRAQRRAEQAAARKS
jgi:hypothetical protein